MTQLLSQLLPSGITRRISLRAAYDTLSDDMHHGGIHNAEIFFSVSRGDAGIEWGFSTGWYLRKTRERKPNVAMRSNGDTYEKIHSPDGLGCIAHHSPVATYEGQTSSKPDGGCMFTHGECFGDASYIASGELFDRAVADPETIWQELETRLQELEIKIKDQRENARNFS